MMKQKVFKLIYIAVALMPLLVRAQKSVPSAAPKPLAEPKMPDLCALSEEISVRVEKEIALALPKLKSLEKIHLDIKNMPELPMKFESLLANSPIEERSKSIVKEFKVSSNDKLAVNNQYGNVNVNVWNKSLIRIEVEIKAFERSGEKAEELLQQVSVSESKSSNQISFITRISRENTSGGWSGIRRSGVTGERRGVEVNYTIYMPSKNALNIENKYGNIVLPAMTGVVTINASYGTLNADKLSNSSNKIKVTYGDATIEDLRAAALNVTYGKLNLQTAETLAANISYSSAKIGKLYGNGELTLRYCRGFRIEEIDKTVKGLNVDAAYSSLSLGFEPAASFDFDVTVSYGGFNYPEEKVIINSKSPDEPSRGRFTKNFKGQIGKGSDAKVVVNSRYGVVDFN